MTKNPDGSMMLSEEELEKLFKELDNAIETYDPYSYGGSRRGYNPYDGSDWLNDNNEPPRIPQRHEWRPVLLLMSTVYNCVHCGLAKEKSKGAYCDEENEF